MSLSPDLSSVRCKLQSAFEADDALWWVGMGNLCAGYGALLQNYPLGKKATAGVWIGFGIVCTATAAWLKWGAYK